MQQLWQTTCGWDEAVPSHIETKWNAFRVTLPIIQTLKIPSWTTYTPNCHLQVDGFSDASEQAYCGAVYLRIHDGDQISSRLLVAKARVAPLKTTTIPKLELCAAVLLVDLLKRVMPKIPSNHQLFLWTYSSIVLGWLQKSPQSLKTFVSNRISKLLDFCSVSTWQHVRTEDNPADLGTRGSLTHDLIQSKLWWHGPPWLLLPNES